MDNSDTIEKRFEIKDLPVSKNKENLSQPELLILKSLQSGKRRYGLEIRSAIEDSFNRRFNFSSLYPKLDLLEAKGYVKSEEDEDILKTRANSRRKYFKITAEGSKVLRDWEASFTAVCEYGLSEQPAF